MLPVIIGVGIAALIAKSIFDNDSEEKRVFISFSMKDEKYRNHLVKQSKEERSPFSFVDMSVKKPWAEEKWKTECRKRIVSCDAVIVLLSKNTWHSSGTRWEIKCAKEAWAAKGRAALLHFGFRATQHCLSASWPIWAEAAGGMRPGLGRWRWRRCIVGMAFC